MITIKTDNDELKELIKKIEALGDSFSSRRQRLNMLRGGANIIRDAVRAKTPVALKTLKLRRKEIQPGFTKESIKVKTLRRSNSLWVGPKKQSGILAFWLTYLEFGARNRDGSKREGLGFIKRALEEKRKEATQRIIDDAKRLLEKISKQIAKNHGR